jgi:hypothetical protein
MGSGADKIARRKGSIRMQRGVIAKLCLSGVTIIGLLAGSQSVAARSSSKQTPVSPVFRSLLPALARTHVPAYLPVVFPEAGKTRLYATLQGAKAGHYQVNIDYTADCHGADACHYGDLDGRSLPAGKAKPSGTRVDLGHHVTAYFVTGGCGASCAESTITWDAGSYRYVVGAKISHADLVAFAKSAVNAGPYPAPAGH